MCELQRKPETLPFTVNIKVQSATIEVILDVRKSCQIKNSDDFSAFLDYCSIKYYQKIELTHLTHS